MLLRADFWVFLFPGVFFVWYFAGFAVCDFVFYCILFVLWFVICVGCYNIDFAGLLDFGFFLFFRIFFAFVCVGLCWLRWFVLCFVSLQCKFRVCFWFAYFGTCILFVL